MEKYRFIKYHGVWRIGILELVPSWHDKNIIFRYWKMLDRLSGDVFSISVLETNVDKIGPEVVFPID